MAPTSIAIDELSRLQLDEQEIGSKIRYLGVEHAKLTSLVANSNFKDGERKKSKALISKRGIENPRYRMEVREPRLNKIVVTSGTEIESAGVTVAAIDGVPLEDTIYNPRTGTRARIENITGLVIKGASYGEDTFSCKEGDELIVMATATDEFSETVPIINGSSESYENTLQLSRYSVSISWLKEGVKQKADLGAGSRYADEKMVMLWENLDAFERNALFNVKTADIATKNTSTGVQTGYAKEFMTSQGLVDMAAYNVSAHGAGNLKWVQQQLPLHMGPYVDEKEVYIAFCSNLYYSRLFGEMGDKYAIDKSGEMKIFGIKATDVLSAGPNIHFVKHDAFNSKFLQDKALVLAPKDLGYVYKNGYDMAPNANLQPNKAIYKQDGVFTAAGMETKNAGKTLTWVTDLFNA